MIVSLNWLRDFVDIPASLNPQQLALKFTTTTAEVEGVVEHRANFEGLLAARIDGVEPVEGEAKLKRVQLTADRPYSTLSAAPDLAVGDLVIFGPPGARVAGQRLTTKDPAGRESAGMIVAGQTIQLIQVGAGGFSYRPRPGPVR